MATYPERFHIEYICMHMGSFVSIGHFSVQKVHKMGIYRRIYPNVQKAPLVNSHLCCFFNNYQ